MMVSPIRIIFMGTPEFAVPSLRILADAGYQVVAVVTAPDKPSGRGLKMHSSPVKEFALGRGIPVLQPVKLSDPVFIDELRSLHADLQVVVAFRMLPREVWQMPPLGTFNLHASLLPDYRGAAPINRAVMNGETQTGATTFFLQHEIDTGDIILQEKMPIGPDEDAGSVHDRLMEAGVGLVLRTVDLIAAGQVVIRKQEITGEPKAAPKIFKDDGLIDWKGKNLDQVHNLVRGLSPYPGAWTHLDGKIVKIYKTEKEPAILSDLPGKIVTDHKSLLKIACHGGYLHILELQMEGRKKMLTKDFLRGYVIRSTYIGE